MRVQVDRVVISNEPVVPPRLDVRNFKGIADRLDMAGSCPRLGAEYRGHAAVEGLAHCVTRNKIRIRVTGCSCHSSKGKEATMRTREVTEVQVPLFSF